MEVRRRKNAAWVAAGAVVILCVLGVVLHQSGSGGGVSSSVCGKSIGDLAGVSTAVGYGEAEQVELMSQDAFNVVQDAGGDGSGFANDLLTLGDDAGAWRDTPMSAQRAAVVADLGKVYGDCGETYQG